MDEQPKLRRYHFDIGDSTKGPIGFSGAVHASSLEEALKVFKEHLPTELTVRSVLVKDIGDTLFEYAEAYINPDAITVNDIDEVTDP